MMDDLIPSISWTDFQKVVKMGRVADLKSCIVTFNSEHLFTVIIPHGDMFSQDYAKTQAMYLASKSNIVGGLEPEEILETVKV